MTSTLNPEQRRAVDHDNGPLIVLAGPGTGKTRVIIARLARLLEGGADPRSLLALTFSVKAAEEMRARLAEAVDERTAAHVAMHTFHSFGKRIVDRFGDVLGLPRDLTLMDSAMSTRLLRRLIREHDLFTGHAAKGRDSVIPRARRFIEACRNAGKQPEDAQAFADQWSARLAAGGHDLPADPDALQAQHAAAADFAELARLYALFDDASREEGLFTFDDLLTLPLRIFDARPVAQAIVRDELRHVVVDEFQDVNAAQIELLRRIAPPTLPSGRAPDLCVVGDDDQAIYGFRGADTHAFTRFAAIWTRHTTIPLTINYRSAAPIIQACNAAITLAGDRFQPDKIITPAPGITSGSAETPPAGVEGLVVSDDDAAGTVIAAMILDDRARNPSRAWREYAVIARTGSYLDTLAIELRLAGIPVTLREKVTPLDDPAVRDLLAWMDLLTSPDDVTGARRLLTRPPMLVSLEQVQRWSSAHARARSDGETRGLADWLAEHHPSDPAVIRLTALLKELRAVVAPLPADRAVDEIVRRAGLAHHEHLDPAAKAARIARLVRVLKFVRARQPHLDPPGDLAAFLAYYQDLDETDQQAFAVAGEERLSAPDDDTTAADAVNVITAHASKGLEFEVVFVTRVRPGHGFPHTMGGSGGDDGPALPPAFTGVAPADALNEERRLFYVACTRAERRLVLVAKHKKNRGKTTDYFCEITEDVPGLTVPVSAGHDWLRKSGIADPDAVQSELAAAAAETESRRAAILARELSAVRHEAFAALHDAERAADAAALDDARRRLAESADAIAALGALRAGVAAPAFIRLPPDRAPRLDELARRLAHAAQRDHGPRPKAPLDLSYTAIRQYLDCPACYYLKYVLRFTEPESAAVNVGVVVHAALQKFLQEIAAAEAEGHQPPGRARLLALGEALFREHTPRHQPFDPAVREQVQAQLALYHDRLHDDAQVLHIEAAAQFPYTLGEHTHRFRAKLDRVDRLPDNRIRIVDYKTSDAYRKLLEPEATDLQFGVYALALPRLLDPDDPSPELPPGVAEYWILSTGQKGSIDLSKLKLDKAREKIDAAITGILAGRFNRGSQCYGFCEGLMDD